MYGPGEDDLLQIPANPDHIINRIPVTDPGNILVNYRSLVQFIGHVVTGCPYDLHTPLVGMVIRPGPRKRRQKGMVDVNDLIFVLPDKIRGEYLHITGQDHKIDLANPYEFPEFYVTENYFDFSHFNEKASIQFTMELAKKFNALVQ